MCKDAPAGVDEFDQWVVRRLLSPSSAMFREGNVLLYEQPELGDWVLGIRCNDGGRRTSPS